MLAAPIFLAQSIGRLLRAVALITALLVSLVFILGCIMAVDMRLATGFGTPEEIFQFASVGAIALAVFLISALKLRGSNP